MNNQCKLNILTMHCCEIQSANSISSDTSKNEANTTEQTNAQ